jgi:hypothetical protein
MLPKWSFRLPKFKSFLLSNTYEVDNQKPGKSTSAHPWRAKRCGSLLRVDWYESVAPAEAGIAIQPVQLFPDFIDLTRLATLGRFCHNRIGDSAGIERLRRTKNDPSRGFSGPASVFLSSGLERHSPRIYRGGMASETSTGKEKSMSTPQHCPGFERFRDLKSFLCNCPHCGKGIEIFSDEFDRKHTCKGCRKEIDFTKCTIRAEAATETPR